MDIRDAYIGMKGNIRLKQVGEDEFKVFQMEKQIFGVINKHGKMLLELCTGKYKIKEINHKRYKYINKI